MKCLKEIMVMRELPQPKKAYILFRGQYTDRRAEVPMATPAVLPPLPPEGPRAIAWAKSLSG